MQSRDPTRPVRIGNERTGIVRVGGGLGADHPMAWAHEVGAGRSFYTALGHTDASYGEPLFREHLRRAIVWAARLE